MKMVFLLAMVGASDVQVKFPDRLQDLGINLNYERETPTGWTLRSPREDGRILWERYRRNNTLGQLIDLPILRLCINYIRQLNLGDQLSVYLFYTDQRENVTYRNKDTLYFAQIARIWLPEYFAQFGYRVDVKPVAISKNCNPVDSYHMLRFFERRLRELVPPNAVKWVFTSQTGGIPTVYESLFLQAIRIYREKCTPLYVLPDGTVFPVDFREFLLETFYREHAKGLVERHYYAPAAEFLENLNLPFHAALCRHAAFRLLFDLKRAKDALESLPVDISLSYEEDQILADLRRQMDELVRDLPEDADKWNERISRLELWILELYWGIEIAFAQESWLEFLGRLIRFTETILQLVLERQFKLPFATVSQILKSAKAIQDIYGLSIDLHDIPTKTNLNMLHTIIKEISQKAKELVTDEMETVANFAQEIESKSLISLRNHSILGHGFRGVSKEEIEVRVNNIQNLLEACQEVLKILITPRDRNPYEIIKQVVLRALQ
jgi:hypothetical protein